MAVRRYRKRAYRRRAVYRPRRSTKTTRGRRSYGSRGTRGSGARIQKKPRNSKSILELTTRKKRDTMMQWTNVAGPIVSSNNYNSNRAVLLGSNTSSTPYIFPWCATARSYFQSPNARGSVEDIATRTSQSTYMVGLSEKVEIQVNNGAPWQWRRICFTYKPGPGGIRPPTTSYSEDVLTSSGQMRVVNHAGGILSSNEYFDLIFKGTYLQDWVDPMDAPTDNQRVTIKYDQTITIASGNERGMIRTYQRYHPMGASLIYNDDEVGGDEGSGTRSVSSKAGMGDYYVIDMFQAQVGATNTDALTFRPNSTLYWHEK